MILGCAPKVIVGELPDLRHLTFDDELRDRFPLHRRQRTGPGGAQAAFSKCLAVIPTAQAKGSLPAMSSWGTATLRPVRMPQRSSRRAGQVVPSRPPSFEVRAAPCIARQAALMQQKKGSAHAGEVSSGDRLTGVKCYCQINRLEHRHDPWQKALHHHRRRPTRDNRAAASP
jgi:hypothetical protein